MDELMASLAIVVMLLVVAGSVSIRRQVDKEDDRVNEVFRLVNGTWIKVRL